MIMTMMMMMIMMMKTTVQPPIPPHPTHLRCFCSFSVSSTLPHVMFSCHIVNIHHDEEEEEEEKEKEEEDYYAVHRKLFP